MCEIDSTFFLEQLDIVSSMIFIKKCLYMFNWNAVYFIILFILKLYFLLKCFVCPELCGYFLSISH